MQKLIIMFIVLFLSGAGMVYAFDLEELEIHGFASTGYMQSDANNFLVPSEDGSFEFNEAGLNIATALTNDIRAGIQLFSRDQGSIGNNDIKLDWAFLNYQWKEEAGVRLGKMKLPYGLYNDTRDYDMLRTSILLPQSVYNEDFRETLASYQGIGLNGNVALSVAGRLNYDAFTGTFGVESDGGIAKLLSTSAEAYKSTTVRYLAGGRIRWYFPLQGLMLGSTYYQSDATYKTESRSAPIETTLEPEYQTFVFSGEYNLGDITVAAEYLRVKSDTVLKIDMTALELPNPEPIELTNENESYYALIAYRFTDWFEGGAYYSIHYADTDDRDGRNQIERGQPDHSAWQKDRAASLRFDFTDSWLLKLEVHVMNGTAFCAQADNPDGTDQHWTLFAAKTTFNF